MLVSAVLVATTLFATTATPVFAAYNGPCHDVDKQHPANNEHMYLVRDQNMFPGRVFTGARGEVYVGYYQACSPVSPNGSGGMSLDMIANVDGDVGYGWNLAQCAVGQITGHGTHFWYTPRNNGQLAAFGPTPHYGDHYRCGIRRTSNGALEEWEYNLTNMYTGQEWHETSIRYGEGSSQVWWGFEVDDSNDEMGGRAGTGNHNAIYKPGYWYSGASGLWYATGDTTSDIKFTGGTMMSYWHYKAYQDNGYDVIEGWTDSH